MPKYKLKKPVMTGALVMLLSVLTTCVNEDLPVKPEITDVTVSANGALVGKDGYVILQNTADEQASSAVIHATAIGDDSASIAWSIISGGNFVTLAANTSNTITVTAKAVGTAKIRAEASNPANMNTTDFFVVVNQAGVNWTFSISDGETSLEGGTLFVNPEDTEPVTLKAETVGTAGTTDFTWANSTNSVVTLSATAGDTVTVNAASGVTAGSSTITVTATRDGATITKSFTVEISAEEEVLFEWNSKTRPVTAAIVPLDATIYSGFGNIFFRVVNLAEIAENWIPVEIRDGAFRLAARKTLIIGGTFNTVSGAHPIGSTAGPVHQPGMFDLSYGKIEITVDYRDPGGATVLRVFVNNSEGTAAIASVLGEKSMVYHYDNVTQIETGTGITRAPTNQVTQKAEPNRIIMSLTPSERYANYTTDNNEGGGPMSAEGTESLKTAFIALMSFGSVNGANDGITITGVKIVRR